MLEAVAADAEALELERHNITGAIALWQAIARFNISFPNTLLNLAGAFDDIGKIDLADIAFRTALAQDPNYDLNLLYYAMFLTCRGRPYDALRILRRLGTPHETIRDTVAETCARATAMLPNDTVSGAIREEDLDAEPPTELEIGRLLDLSGADHQRPGGNS